MGRPDATGARRPTRPAPPRADSEARARLLAGEPPEAVSPTWPAFGRSVVGDDGRMLREVTFVADLPAGHEGMIHLNGITDGHRHDLGPALLERVPGAAGSDAPLGVIAYLLPDDLVASYRFASAPHLPRDAGLTHAGWRSIHRLGCPDPRNPRELPNPLGTRSSVLVMPGARVHPAWEARTPREPREVRAEVVPIDGDTSLTVLRPAGAADGRVLLLFDGEHWAGAGVREALARHLAPPATVVLVPSGDLARRAALLPHPERVIAHLETEVLPAVAALIGGLPDPSRVVVAGQSYGGLAAASVAALRPDLAATAIVQSGSFHFRADEESRVPAGQVGDLVRRLAEASVSGRFAVQAGTEEAGMLDLARSFADAARAAGGDVTLRAYTGGHDYAWWCTGLFDALDELAAR
ncbi:DUF3327 domain-containing protein [Agromyces intestinalis]|uniref:DUF3327 domain-containing protein n=1 Tax=Agromyces intestinalis TaxID=2592652 RepID=A0A5C1YIQ8_9MICO|nr:alpha/beta hydrolase-fold protein [Agromyces intestinalis]QEO14662.1 DUF3327 domain-containing protein [Agromyces intestinalis]